MLQYPKELKPVSQRLRRFSTEAEKHLWTRLRGKQIKGLQFYRQKIIERYIVDFYCPKARLVIELDGGQHYEDSMREKDAIRDEILKGLGLRVLRFSDREVLTDTDTVIEMIWSCS